MAHHLPARSDPTPSGKGLAAAAAAAAATATATATAKSGKSGGGASLQLLGVVTAAELLMLRRGRRHGGPWHRGPSRHLVGKCLVQTFERLLRDRIPEKLNVPPHHHRAMAAGQSRCGTTAEPPIHPSTAP